MAIRFVSKPIEPAGSFDPEAMSRGEPALPPAFRFEERDYVVGPVLRSWRSTKDDRGETYLKRHWFEFETNGGRRAVVYFDRGARKDQPRWWLYTLSVG